MKNTILRCSQSYRPLHCCMLLLIILNCVYAYAKDMRSSPQKNIVTISGTLTDLSVIDLIQPNNPTGSGNTKTLTVTEVGFSSNKIDNNGFIQLGGLDMQKKRYLVVYTKGVTEISRGIFSASGNLKIDHLSSGIYSKISVTDQVNPSLSINAGTITIVNTYRKSSSDQSTTSIPIRQDDTFKSFTATVSKLSFPSNEKKDNGSITISGLKPAKGKYVVTYLKDKAAQNPKGLKSVDGDLTIQHLPSGTYSYIKILDQINSIGYTVTNSLTLVNENDGTNVATQAIGFFGAVFTNYNGIVDNDPVGYTQFYGRLSVPTNRIQGIEPDSRGWKRIIPLRNFLLTFTYGNTDAYKLNTFNALNDRLVNRLDLYSHANINAGLYLNILTAIMPSRWFESEGDLGHIYLDLYSNFLATTVTDQSTNTNYRVSSNLYGINLKANLNKNQSARFIPEIGFRVFRIYASSSSINSNLSPQNDNIDDIKLGQNANKSFVNGQTPTYLGVDAQIQYNTSDDPGNNASNIFIKYSYNSNYKNYGAYYPNNYYQLKIGYVLDIAKIFYPAPKSPEK